MTLMHKGTYDKDLFARRAGKSGIVPFPIMLMTNGITINMFDGHGHCRLHTLRLDQPIRLTPRINQGRGAKAPLRSLTRLAISTMPQFVDTRGHRATRFGASSGRFHDKISLE